MTEHHVPVPVPAAWRHELLLALRLRDVDGARIGDVLAEVEEFCTDSGMDAPTAFGDPHEYAASLTSASGSTPPRVRDDLRAVGRVLAGFVGLMVVLAVVVEDGPDLVVTAGWLLGSVLVLGATVLVVRTMSATLATSGWRGAVAPAVVVALTLAAVVTLGLLLDAPVVTVPDVVALAVGIALLVGDAVVGTVRALRRPTADLVTPPGADPDETRRRNVRADVLVAWTLPAFALVGSVLLAGLGVLLA
jgi:hypothetical protein